MHFVSTFELEYGRMVDFSRIIENCGSILREELEWMDKVDIKNSNPRRINSSLWQLNSRIR